MFTMRRKEKANNGKAENDVIKSCRRLSAFGTIEGQQNCRWDERKEQGQKRLKSSRNSLLIPGSSAPNECLIHLLLGPGCFRELRRSSGGGSIYSLAIYNLICSLLVFALRILSHPQANGQKGHKCFQQQQPVTVLLEAPKVPLKALRIVLRACQSALAYRIRQCILLEPDSFLGLQQRVATIDLLLLDTYDFKIQICPRQKLAKYLGLTALFDLQQIWQPPNSQPKRIGQKPIGGIFEGDGLMPTKQNNWDGWTDLKKGFLAFFAANPSYFAANPPNTVLLNGSAGSPASLSKFMRKDGNMVLIELVEFDLDSVPRPTPKMNDAEMMKGNSAREIGKKYGEMMQWDKNNNNEKDQKEYKKNSNIGMKMPTLMAAEDCSGNKFADDFSQSLPNSKKQSANSSNLMNKLGCGHNRHKSLEERREARSSGEALTAELEEEAGIGRLAKSVQSVVGWLGEHGERRLAKLEEAEESLNGWPSNSLLCVELEKIEKEKRELAEEMENILNKLATVAEQLKGMEQKKTRQITHFGIGDDENGEEERPAQKPKELIAVGQLLLGAQSRANSLRVGLSSLTVRMEKGQHFRNAVDTFHNAANSLLLALCNEGEDGGRTASIYGKEEQLNDQKIGTKIAEFRKNMEKLEKLAQSAIENGSILCNILRSKNEKALDLCSSELATIEGRRRRCAALVELRIGRLNQRIEIIKCEQIGEQIIKRFNDSLAGNNAKMVGDLLNSRRNGKRLVDYARQMAHLATILRKINQLEASPAECFKQELESLWRRLEKKYGNGGPGVF